MQRRDAHDNSALPPELLRSTPRQVRPSIAGLIVLIVANGLVVAAIVAGPILYSRAISSERRNALFASESVRTTARVVRIQRRGGGNNRRSVVHYRYTVDGGDYTGATTVRRPDRDRYQVGSDVPIRHLATETESSWLEGYGPRREALWPVFVVPAIFVVCGFVLVQLVRRQRQLLEYGRPALGRVTKVEKKRSDKGSFWRVHYEWTLLNGATRAGRYKDTKKQPPAVGMPVTIVYDRDQPLKNAKYPMSLVRLKP